jgi:hypothetical protein
LDGVETQEATENARLAAQFQSERLFQLLQFDENGRLVEDPWAASEAAKQEEQARRDAVETGKVLEQSNMEQQLDQEAASDDVLREQLLATWPKREFGPL